MAVKERGTLTASASRSIIDCCCACNGCSSKHPVGHQKGKETCKAKQEVAAFSPLLARAAAGSAHESHTNSKYGKVLIDLNHGGPSLQKAP